MHALDGHVDVVADAEALTDTIPPGSYDYVVSTSMLEHTPHPWKVLDEVYKVLRPGGILYVSVPWMYPLHAEPNDYWRFSVPCLHIDRANRKLLSISGCEAFVYMYVRTSTYKHNKAIRSTDP